MCWIGINGWFKVSIGLKEEAIDAGIDQLACRIGFVLADIGTQSIETGLASLVTAALEEVLRRFLGFLAART